jgi:hypothetical protein
MRAYSEVLARVFNLVMMNGFLPSFWKVHKISLILKDRGSPLDVSLICIEGVESKLGPLGTSATAWPIVPSPVDYDDGEVGAMKIGRGNRSTRRKPAPAPLCPPQIPLHQTRI